MGVSPPSSTLQIQWLKWNSTRPCVANTRHRSRQARLAHCINCSAQFQSSSPQKVSSPISIISRYPPAFARVDAETKQGK